jgi:hypothetical protein
MGAGVGSSAHGELVVVALDSVSQTQRIQGKCGVQSDLGTESKGDHGQMIAPAGACVAGQGSSVHAVSVGSGMFSVANFDNQPFFGNVVSCNPV